MNNHDATTGSVLKGSLAGQITKSPLACGPSNRDKHSSERHDIGSKLSGESRRRLRLKETEISSSEFPKLAPPLDNFLP